MSYINTLPADAKPVPGFDNYYCTPEGVLIFNKYGKFKVRKPTENKRGYIRMCLMRSGKREYVYLHRIVASTFIGESNFPVNHKDNNHKNNHVNNLEYVNLRENGSHSSIIRGKPPGVHQIKKSKMWYAQLYLGSFKTKEEAMKAYSEALNVLQIENKYIE